jgi:hypothetical protein
VYTYERALLKHLVSDGKTLIPRKLFIEAYFENYGEAEDPNTGVPKWKTLIAVLEKSFGPGYLQALDFLINNYINEIGFEYDISYRKNTAIDLVLEKAKKGAHAIIKEAEELFSYHNKYQHPNKKP